MPWFITAICSKKTMQSTAEKYQTLPVYIPRSRCFGFYNTYNEAYKAVEENRGSMCECLYDYIVMEYIEPGIHPMVHAVQWWAWNDASNKWDFLCQEDEPKEFRGTINFALG